MAWGAGSLAETAFGELVGALSGSSGSAALASSRFYTRLRDVTLPRMLSKFQTGAVRLFKQTETPVEDDVLASVTISETEYPLVAVVFGYPEDKVDNDLIKRSDLRVLFGAADLGNEKPTIEDRLRIDGVHYVIKNVRAVPAAGITVLYEVQVGLQS